MNLWTNAKNLAMTCSTSILFITRTLVAFFVVGTDSPSRRLPREHPEIAGERWPTEREPIDRPGHFRGGVSAALRARASGFGGLGNGAARRQPCPFFDTPQSKVSRRVTGQ
jgi:hypothetical protein